MTRRKYVYLTSLPLVSVCRHVRVTRWKSRKNVQIELTYLEVSRLSIEFLGYVSSFLAWCPSTIIAGHYCEHTISSRFSQCPIKRTTFPFVNVTWPFTALTPFSLFLFFFQTLPRKCRLVLRRTQWMVGAGHPANSLNSTIPRMPSLISEKPCWSRQAPRRRIWSRGAWRPPEWRTVFPMEGREEFDGMAFGFQLECNSSEIAEVALSNRWSRHSSQQSVGVFVSRKFSDVGRILDYPRKTVISHMCKCCPSKFCRGPYCIRKQSRSNDVLHTRRTKFQIQV